MITVVAKKIPGVANGIFVTPRNCGDRAYVSGISETGIFAKYHALIFCRDVMAVNGAAERDSIAVNFLLNAAKGNVSLTVWVPAAATSCPTQVSAAVGQIVPQSEPNSQVY